MIASQFSRSWDSCFRNVTGCLATCWMVQNASWSQLEPGKMMTPNFIACLLGRSNQSLARKKKTAWVVTKSHTAEPDTMLRTSHWAAMEAKAIQEPSLVAEEREELRREAAPAERICDLQIHRCPRAMTSIAATVQVKGPCGDPSSSW